MKLNKADVEKALWIGGARVKQAKIQGTLGDADGAYVNVIALAAGESDFRLQIKKALEELNLSLVKLANAELLAERLKKHTMHKELHALAKEVKRTGSLRFDVFATFDAGYREETLAPGALREAASNKALQLTARYLRTTLVGQ